MFNLTLFNVAPPFFYLNILTKTRDLYIYRCYAQYFQLIIECDHETLLRSKRYSFKNVNKPFYTMTINQVFIKWLSFVIFKTSNELVKEKYRKIEKTNIKLVKNICHHKFNQTCLTNNFLPTYTNIRLHDDAVRSEKFVLEFRRNLIKREMREQEEVIEEATEELRTLKKEFSECLNSPLRYKAFMFFLSRTSNKEQQELKLTQSKKLSDYYGAAVLQKQERDSVINLSKKHLDKETVEALSFGMNCHLRSKTDKTKKKVEIERLYYNIKNEEKKKTIAIENDELLQSQLKAFGLKKNKDYHKDVLTKEQHTLLRNLRMDEEVIIRKADKSNMFVVLDRSKYCEKINELISDRNKFERIEKNPIPNIKSTINKYVTSINAVNSSVKLKELIGHFEPAYIYGNPKIHKNAIDPPLRPIISQIGTPTYDVSKQLNNIIVKYMPNKYMVDSAYEFLSLVKSSFTTGLLASLDVESLFTNVPVHDTIEIILNNVYRNETLSPPNSIPENSMKELLLLCTTKSPFRGVDGLLYTQNDGVMMGSPLGPTFANFYMCNLENKIAQDYPEDMPFIYARYVDDIFLLVQNVSQINKLKNLFEVHSVLKFTFEIEKNNQLAFLDTILTKQESTISTTVYVKTTSSGDCINFSSICPDTYKKGAIKTLLHRAYQICSSWDSLHQEIYRLKQLFTNNDYPMALIDKTINQFLHKNLTNTDQSQPTSGHTIKMFFCNQMCSNYKIEETQLQKIIQNNLKTVREEDEIKLYIYYRNKKLKNLVMRNRYQPPMEDSHVVYKYTCTKEECNSSEKCYIGYTEMTIKDRMRNHGQHGSIIEHLREEHSIQKVKTKELMESVTVIGRANTKQDLLLLEALHIKQNKPALNSQQEGRDRVLRIF